MHCIRIGELHYDYLYVYCFKFFIFVVNFCIKLIYRLSSSVVKKK